MIKANRVPILVRSVTKVRFSIMAGMPTTSPVMMVAKEGVLNLGWMREKIFGNKPVTAHTHPDPGLPELEDQQNTGHGDQGGEGYYTAHPVQPYFPEGKRQRIADLQAGCILPSR